MKIGEHITASVHLAERSAMERRMAAAANSTVLGGRMGMPHDLYQVVGRVGVINVSNMICWGGLQTAYSEVCPGDTLASWLIEAVRMAHEDPKTRSVAFIIDSPGGESQAMIDVVDAMREAKRKNGKNTVAICYKACSAGYLIASQCDRIFAPEIGLVGSIGTVITLTDTSKLMEDIGIRTVVVSSGGLKGALADGRVTPELVAEVQRVVDRITDWFVRSVAEGRRMNETAVRALATGQVWTALDAKERGLIDGVATMRQVLEAMNTAGAEL